MSLSRVRRITDPAKRAHAAAVLLREQEAKAEASIAEIRGVRDDAAWAMLEATGPDGRAQYRPADVARTIGVTRAAVAQRFRRERRPG